MGQVLVLLATVFICPNGRLQHKNNQIFRLMGRSSSRLRFSKRSPARNVSTSEIEVWTQEDSNSFEGDFEAKERRFCGALFADA